MGLSLLFSLTCFSKPVNCAHCLLVSSGWKPFETMVATPLHCEADYYCHTEATQKHAWLFKKKEVWNEVNPWQWHYQVFDSHENNEAMKWWALHGQKAMKWWALGCLSGLVQNLNVVIFLDIINVLVKLWMMMALTELYPFIPFSMTFMIFWGYGGVKQLKMKLIIFLCNFWSG